MLGFKEYLTENNAKLPHYDDIPNHSPQVEKLVSEFKKIVKKGKKANPDVVEMFLDRVSETEKYHINQSKKDSSSVVRNRSKKILEMFKFIRDYIDKNVS